MVVVPPELRDRVRRSTLHVLLASASHVHNLTLGGGGCRTRGGCRPTRPRGRPAQLEGHLTPPTRPRRGGRCADLPDADPTHRSTRGDRRPRSRAPLSVPDPKCLRLVGAGASLRLHTITCLPPPTEHCTGRRSHRFLRGPPGTVRRARCDAPESCATSSVRIDTDLFDTPGPARAARSA